MKTLRAMIVEIDAIIGSLLAELLKAPGHEVCAIEPCESSALAVAGRSKPDLMIIDAQLHDGSGIRARQALDAVPYLVVLACPSKRIFTHHGHGHIRGVYGRKDAADDASRTPFERGLNACPT